MCVNDECIEGNGYIGYTVYKSDLCTSIYVKLAVIVMPDIAVSMVIRIRNLERDVNCNITINQSNP